MKMFFFGLFISLLAISIGMMIWDYYSRKEFEKKEIAYKTKIDSLKRKNDSLSLEIKKIEDSISTINLKIDSLMLAADGLETIHYVYVKKLEKNKIEYENKIKELKKIFFSHEDSVYIRNYFSKFFVH